jgi:hypothetical protein
MKDKELEYWIEYWMLLKKQLREGNYRCKYCNGQFDNVWDFAEHICIGKNRRRI